MWRADEFVDHFAAHIGDLVAHIVGRHDLLALLEHDLALVVEHVVVFQDVLAHLEIARFDLLLRFFERLVHPRMGDRFAFFETQPLQDRIHALRPEDAHQVVLQAQEEFRRAGIALTARTAAQLVVDAPAFVAFRADDVETAGGERALFVGGDFGADLRVRGWRARLRRRCRRARCGCACRHCRPAGCRCRGPPCWWRW